MVQSSQKFSQKFHCWVHLWFLFHHEEVRISLLMNVAWLHISVTSFPSTTGHTRISCVFYASKCSMRGQFCSVLILQFCGKLQFYEKLFGESHPVVLSLGAALVLLKDRFISSARLGVRLAILQSPEQPRWRGPMCSGSIRDQ